MIALENHLSKTVLIQGHNVCFYAKKKNGKSIPYFPCFPVYIWGTEILLETFVQICREYDLNKWMILLLLGDNVVQRCHGTFNTGHPTDTDVWDTGKTNLLLEL